MVINLLSLGRVTYTEGLAIQQRLVAARKAGQIEDTLVLLEHPPVLTLGRNAKREHVLASDELLARKGVELHIVNRGGDVTYHGPGQLVGYPIVDLRGDLPGKKGPHLGPVDFVRLLEEILIRVCGDYEVLAERVRCRTGVWTLAQGAIPERKLAAIGIHVSQGVTSHGFALNVTTDLRDFDWIVPCGIADRAVTSLELESPIGHLSSSDAMQQAIHSVSRHFGRVLQRQMIWTDSLETLFATSTLPEVVVVP